MNQDRQILNTFKCPGNWKLYLLVYWNSTSCHGFFCEVQTKPALLAAFEGSDHCIHMMVY